MDSVNSLSELFPVRDSASDRGPRSVEQMGSEDFLALMVAQLENQDPTKPMDDMQFMGQLAQFGTVSGIQDLQDSFSGLSSSLTASRALEAANLVGRRVATEGNVALLAPGGAGAADPEQLSLGATVEVPAGVTAARLFILAIAAGDLHADLCWRRLYCALTGGELVTSAELAHAAQQRTAHEYAHGAAARPSTHLCLSMWGHDRAHNRGAR